MQRASEKIRHVLTVVRDLGMPREVAALREALATCEDMEMAIINMNVVLGSMAQRRVFESVDQICRRVDALERENAQLKEKCRG